MLAQAIPKSIFKTSTATKYPYIPKQMIKASASYHIPTLPKLKVGGVLKWQDDITTPTGIAEQESYALLDLLVSYQITESITAAVNVDNITDEKYYNSLYWEAGLLWRTSQYQAVGKLGALAAKAKVNKWIFSAGATSDGTSIFITPSFKLTNWYHFHARLIHPYSPISRFRYRPVPDCYWSDRCDYLVGSRTG